MKSNKSRIIRIIPIILIIKNTIIGTRHFLGKSESMIKNLRINPSLKNLKQRNGSTFNQRRREMDATKTYR